MDKFLVRPDLRDLQGGGEEPAPTGGASGDLKSPDWRHLRAEGLSCDYTVLFGKAEADKIFRELEQEVEYFTDMLAWNLCSVYFSTRVNTWDKPQ